MFVRALTGTFYSHEVAAYRQYMWIADCAADGIAACGPVVTKNFWMFFTVAAPVILVPLVLVFCSRVARYLRPGPDPVPQPTLHALGLAILMTFGITVVFLATMGFYVQRLELAAGASRSSSPWRWSSGRCVSRSRAGWPGDLTRRSWPRR